MPDAIGVTLVVTGLVLVIAVGIALFGIFNEETTTENSYTQPRREIRTDSRERNCAICFDTEFGPFQRLSCGHDFHSRCIGMWFETNSLCPMCRRDVRP